jgi:hypothetical protein
MNSKTIALVNKLESGAYPFSNAHACMLVAAAWGAVNYQEAHVDACIDALLAFFHKKIPLSEAVTWKETIYWFDGYGAGFRTRTP